MLNSRLIDGNVTNALQSVIAFKIVEKLGKLYALIEMNEIVLYSRADLTGTRLWWQALRKSHEKDERRIDMLEYEFISHAEKQSKPVQKAHKHAVEILVEHSELVELSLLLYTFI